jgi:hypothetical protein
MAIILVKTFRNIRPTKSHNTPYFNLLLLLHENRFRDTMKGLRRLVVFALIHPIYSSSDGQPINTKSGSRAADDRSRIRRESIRNNEERAKESNGDSKQKNKNDIPKQIPLTREEQYRHRQERSERIKRRRDEAKVKIKEMIESPDQYKSGNAQIMTEDEMDRVLQRVLEEDPEFELPKNQWFRSVWGSYKGYQKEEYEIYGLADPSAYYDEWAQAYRMLGAFITCDEGDMVYYNGEEEKECTRWILWAAVRCKCARVLYIKTVFVSHTWSFCFSSTSIQIIKGMGVMNILDTARVKTNRVIMDQVVRKMMTVPITATIQISIIATRNIRTTITAIIMMTTLFKALKTIILIQCLS